MRSEDSHRKSRIGSLMQRRDEQKRLTRRRKLARNARPPNSDPSGAWARQRGTGAPPAGG